ncbi:toxin-antitoxin system YwqK family antitoxin [Vibrio rarus]|uniref:toxin-antitoxin system YwqK family antitoxin n=1 Tax=Vibrio rarus TaxID=413403 RepID=UPI0021C338FC|nr:hypothetical protein [Vibrio rarus]
MNNHTRLLIALAPLTLGACASMFPKSGVLETQFDNGAFQSSYTYVNNHIDGKCKVSTTDNPRNTEIYEGTCKRPVPEGFTGVKNRYQLGKVIQRSEFVDGLNSGTNTLLYPDGSTKAVYQVVDGKKSGDCTTYDERGNITSQGVCSVKGFVGKQNTWYDSGTQASEVEVLIDGTITQETHWYEDGQKSQYIINDEAKANAYVEQHNLISVSIMSHSIEQQWDENGNLIKEGVNSLEGFSGYYYEFYPSGNLKSKRQVFHILLAEDETDWTHTTYFDNPNHTIKIKYIADQKMVNIAKLKGETKIFFENGKLQCRINASLTEDFKHYKESYVCYHPNGHKSAEFTQVDSKQTGVENMWWPNGIKKSAITYANGLESGVCNGWDDKGHKVLTGSFRIVDDKSVFTGKTFFPNNDGDTISRTIIDDKSHGLVFVLNKKSKKLKYTALFSHDSLLLQNLNSKAIPHRNKLGERMYGFGTFKDQYAFSVNDMNIHNVTVNYALITLSKNNQQHLYLGFESLDRDICKTADELPHAININGQNIKVNTWCAKDSLDGIHHYAYVTPSTPAGVKYVLKAFNQKKSIHMNYWGMKTEISAHGFSKAWKSSGGDAL